MSNYYFFGTDEFAAKILDFLIIKIKKPLIVITKSSYFDSKGQTVYSPVSLICQKHKILFVEIKTKLELLQYFKNKQSLTTTFAFLCSYGLIIPQEIIDFFHKRIINVHPSLLPLHRGSNPISTVLSDGDKETGVSLMQLSIKMDAGPILDQWKIKIDDNDDFNSLTEKLQELSFQVIEKNWNKIENKNFELIFQDESKATYTSKINNDFRTINWNKSAEKIRNKIRCLPTKERAFTKIHNLKIFLPMPNITNSEHKNIKPGTIVEITKYNFVVQTKDKFLNFDKIQIAGKKNMKINDFLNGNKWLKANLCFE